MEKLFELTFQDQTLNPQVGTFTDASQTTGTFTLEDGEYYLTNGDTKGFYTYAPIAIQPDSETDNKVTVEFDLKVVTASVNTHTIIGTYAGVDGSGIPTGAKITLQYNAGDIELVLGSGATATLIAAADVVVDQWYHFRIDCALDAPVGSTYEVKIDGAAVTTVTGATTDYELGIISVLGTDLHACDECGIKNIRLITDDDYFVGRTALNQVLQDVKGYVDAHNGVLTIQKNGADIGTFSANQETNETINISVPTKTSDLNNDSGFITGVSWNDVSNKPAFATVATSGSYNDLSNKPTIPTVNNATLTIQKNGTTVKTFTANASSNVTANITVPTKTSDLNNDSGFLTSADALPTGSYIQFAGSQAPAGFLVCNGGAISRTTYSKLFAVISTKYGSGNGSTTFNLPNLTDRFLQGSTTSGTVKNAGLPNITGAFDGTIGIVTVSGAFNVDNLSTGNVFSGDPAYHGLNFNASRSSSIYGKSTTVQPPALTCLICIKY